MEHLPASRLHAVLRATARAAEFRELTEFRTGAVSLVRQLVPCESASYNEVEPGAGALVVADPGGWLPQESAEIFGRFAGENPLIAHYARTGDGRPVRFSDFLSQRRLRALTLYDQIYRPLGVEHQIAFVLPAPPGEIVGIALNRERRDFTDEEVATLDLLRRPLRACYERLVEREHLTYRLAHYESHDEIAERASERGLSARQLDVMRGVIAGASNAQVAMSLGISTRTVDKHLQNIYAQLGVTSRTQAIGRLRSSPGGPRPVAAKRARVD